MNSLFAFLKKDYFHKWDCKLRYVLDQYTVDQIVDDILIWMKEIEQNGNDTNF